MNLIAYPQNSVERSDRFGHLFVRDDPVVRQLAEQCNAARFVVPKRAEGKIFDPHYHEALVQVDNKDLPEHTVVEELQKGYLLNERVIRTAKVKVSKKTEEKHG